VAKVRKVRERPAPVRMLVYAGGRYLDRTRALENGDLLPAGLGGFRYVAFDDLAGLFNSMAVDAPYEAAEMSLSFLLMMVARGDDRLVGIPAFPSRSFRHNQVYVHAGSGIHSPEDLRGRRVGVPEYHMTAALWIRAFLEHDHGIRAADMSWFVAEREAPRFAVAPGLGVKLTSVGDAAELESMLATGALDALLTSTAPKPFAEGSPSIRRLFPDYRPVELAYYQRTGIFPIMHTVVVRRDVYERDRTLAVALLEAFEASKQAAQKRLQHLGTLAVMHPWLGAEMAELEQTFRGDPFAYGFGPNRHVVEAAARFSYEQQLSTRLIDARELFAEETLEWAPPPSPFSTLRW